jgi:hypothetical protein
MLKRFLIISTMLFALLTIAAGCVHAEGASAETEDYEYNEDAILSDPHPVMSLMFTSIEELLNAYVAAREGRTFSDSTGRGVSFMAGEINFTSLGTIYLLTNLPEAYQITRIDVHNRGLWIFYVADEGSRFNPSFSFRFTHFTDEELDSWGMSTPLDSFMEQFGFTEEDYIDGKYLFDARNNELFWAEGGTRLILEVPRTANRNHIASRYSINDMIRFAETIVIDLQDEDNIAVWSAGDFSAIKELLPQGIAAAKQTGSSLTPTLHFTIGRNDFLHNGEIRQAEAAPFISQGRTMIPLRVIAEALGAEVDWDEATRTVMITARGETFKLDDMGIIVNGRTFVPVRYVSETLGAAVRWNEANQTVHIY